MAVATKPRRELADLLASALGKQKAEECVESTADSLGLKNAEVSIDDALRILEHLAQSPGLLGITARFAKSKVLLRWSKPSD
jgi:hypothetical protein